MHTRLIAGRDLDRRDTKDAPPIALVNETFVHRLLSGENPDRAVGRRFRHSTTGKWIEIAGVVEDGKYTSLGESPQITIFEPIQQRWSQNQTLIARSSMPEAETAAQMRRAVLELDPSLSVYADGSLTSALGLALFPAKLAAVVFGCFGLLAVVLAATGIYGIMAYAVSSRTREISIRMALGAAPFKVVRMVVTRTANLLAAGITIGFAMAFAGGRFFSQILYGISAHDPLTYFCAIALMALMAFVACWVPAHRAVHIDPLKSLRVE